MKEIELKSLRKEREKHFLQENGDMIVKAFRDPIHFKKNGVYEEIDNTLIKENDYYINKANSFHSLFKENSTGILTKMITDQYYLEMNLENANLVCLKKVDDTTVCYPNIKNGIDLEYKVMSSKIKENIIMHNIESTAGEISFMMKTNLQLIIKDNKVVMAYDMDKLVYTLEVPYLIDNEQNINENVYYELTKIGDSYHLKLILDQEWLKSASYPVIIDPTISNSTQNTGVYDTYIYSGDTNVNRGNQTYIKAGVEKINGSNRVNRSLLKFDLPTLSTGCQVVEAWLYLIGYPSTTGRNASNPLFVHQVTTDWNEKTANWKTMNDKYDSRVVATLNGLRSNMTPDGTVYPNIDMANITDLVQKWYVDTPNYGMMLKLQQEVYDSAIIPAYFSKDYTENGSVIPQLVIRYKNQNGLESYMDYQTQTFANGSSYVNTYNGNLTSIFPVASTVGGKLPASLSLVYNTNSVILNENRCGLGIGYQFDLAQTIEAKKIGNTEYLEYLDSDGTLHYFLEVDGIYKDEDGLQLTIEKGDKEYLLKDSSNNQMKFVVVGNIGYLTEIINTSNDKNIIEYDNNQRIIKVIDGNLSEIHISYDENEIQIISPVETVLLHYTDHNITSISSKMGNIQITYDSNHMIESIRDISGGKFQYEYCSQKPYRIKSVKSYGSEGSLGNSFTVSYHYLSTTITDNKGRVKTITYNTNGNPISVSNLASKEEVSNAYALTQEYGEGFENDFSLQNKLLSNDIPIQYVKNYLKNTSFEEESIFFIPSTEVNMELSNEEYRTGLKSLKLNSRNPNQMITQNITVPKDHYYTFSVYTKNTGRIRLGLSYMDSNDIVVETITSVIAQHSQFSRSDVTIYYPESATSDLKITIYLEEIGTTYVDDIQLEEGEVANSYNLLENSDFSDGFSGWDISAHNLSTGENLSTSNYFQIVELRNHKKALKIKMEPNNETVLSKKFSIDGKAGDSYYISFWYKNEGILADGHDISNNVIINFLMPEDLDNPQCILPRTPLNTNPDEWQYFSCNFHIMKEYQGIELGIYQGSNVNNLYITNVCLLKDIRQNNYDYDEDGNMVSLSNTANEITNFGYDSNNQLIQMTNPKGRNFTYEYDNTVTNRVISGTSENGICTEIKYDSFGNPILTRVGHKTEEKLETGKYRIRLKGTQDYFRNIKGSLMLGRDNCGHDKWYLESVGEYFRICHSIIHDSYLTVRKNRIVLSTYDENNSLFKFIKQKNGSYFIQVKSSEQYLKASKEMVTVEEIVENDYHYEFYLEITDMLEFIENSAEYTEDGKFIKSLTDSNFNTTYYDIDPTTGLTKSVTDAKGTTTYNTYDEKNRPISIVRGTKKIQYTYNDKNQLNKISQGNLDYQFSYDEFGRKKEIKIGDNIPLVTNYYEDYSGNLKKVIYGNHDSISYDYDEFDRVKSVSKEDNNYHYKYDSTGNLAKIISNDEVISYGYDLSKRLYRYGYNNFKVQYDYDNSNIISKIYDLDDLQKQIHNTFNEDDDITQTSIDDNHINYQYDALGRLIGQNINDNFHTNYEYITNGKRTTLLVKSIDNNNDKYYYKYDECNNITHIFHNGVLERKYAYGRDSDLGEEYIYPENTLVTYNYDDYGNMVTRRYHKLSSSEFLGEDIFEYNNSDWRDQLTSYNGECITYDEIGNPLTIGSKTLTWKNGRQLSSYSNNNVTIQYQYNMNGIRTSKTVNGIETKYYLEGNRVIFEKTSGNMLYYMRDSAGNLVGLGYNNEIYYYIKNIQNDIIGILDSTYQVVARYTYDAWGNILSITDGDGKNIDYDFNHIANINPFRYRSYYYDRETGFYYLNSRYYNPIWGRFLNADGIIGANQDIYAYNLYAYCSNNPIMNIDPNGEFGLALLLGVIVIGAIVVSGGSYYIAEALSDTLSALGGEIARLLDSIKSEPLEINIEKVKESSKSITTTNFPEFHFDIKPCTKAFLVNNNANKVNLVVRGQRLTIKESVTYVQERKSVMCDTKKFAEMVAARVAFNVEGIYGDAEIHGGGKPGYYYHFHVDKILDRPHIWYLN